MFANKKELLFLFSVKYSNNLCTFCEMVSVSLIRCLIFLVLYINACPPPPYCKNKWFQNTKLEPLEYFFLLLAFLMLIKRCIWF
jgi:hypothetical protein